MMPSFSKRVGRISPSGIREFFELVLNEKNIISLGVGEPDFSTPWHIRQAAIASLEKGQTSYTSNRGMEDLRKSIAQYIKKQFKATYNFKNEILLTNGVSEGADLALRAILNPGDEVILPEPNYVCYRPLIELTEGKVISINTSKTNFVPDPDSIEKKVSKKTKAIILCSPNNPTGAVIDKTTLEKIAHIAKKYNLWVIADEIYAELVYETKFTSFASLNDMKDRTILLSGFSKSFAMTGWRLGYICGPEELIENTLKIHQYAAMCTPITAQYAAIEALESGQHAVEDMKESYLSRRNICVERLKKIGLSISHPTGAFYCFPSIKSITKDDTQFAIDLLKKEGVAVVPGSVFGKDGRGHIRICYATGLHELIEALNRIERFIS